LPATYLVVSGEAIHSCKFSNKGPSSTSNSRHSCTLQGILFACYWKASVSLVHIAKKALAAGFCGPCRKTSGGQVSRFPREEGSRTLHWLIGGALDSVTKLHGELEAEPAILNTCRDICMARGAGFGVGAKIWAKLRDGP
jgi:hypothetical protein